MRSIVLTLSLSFIFVHPVQADVISLKSVFNSKTTGEITMTEDKSAKIQYQFNVEDKDQPYAVLVFKEGNCKKFSKPVAVTVNDAKTKDKKNSFNSKGNQFLVFHPASKDLKLTGSAAAPEGSYFAFEPRGKIYVLAAVKDEKSETGLAVACGIFP